MTMIEEAAKRGEGEVVAAALSRDFSHEIQVRRVEFSDGSDGHWVELREPGGCGCSVRVPLGRLIHVMLNLGEAEARQIEAREVCRAGHQHLPQTEEHP